MCSRTCRFTSIALISFFAVAAWSQTSCPAPGLVVAPVLNAASPSTVTLLQPNSMGDWGALDFSTSSPWTESESAASFPQLLGCVPPGPVAKGVSGAAHPPAVASQFIFFGQLARDGNMSAMVAGQTPGNVTVYLGAGNNNLKSTTDYPVGLTPVTVVSASLRMFHAADLIVAVKESATHGDKGGVAVLLNNGDGTFHSAVTWPAGNQPVGVAVGDVDGDGVPDIVTADWQSNTVSVLIGKGDGTFEAPVSYQVNLRPEGVILGDFNGDGNLDIAVGTAVGASIDVLLNDGKGKFPTVVESPCGAQPEYLAAYDFDGDGHLDIAATDPLDGAVSILHGNGDGTFAFTRLYAVSQSPQSLVIADVDGDGIPDIVTAWGNPAILGPDTGSGTIAFLLGNGDGTFRGSTLWSASGNGGSPLIADFNLDGHPDILVANNFSHSLTLIPGAANGTFTAPSTIQLSDSVLVGGGNSSLVTGDFNADGTPDIAVLDTTGGVLIGFGNGDGTFAFQPEIPVAGTPAAVALTDLNGDGAPDLVIASSGSAGTVTTLLGGFDGSFHPPAGILPISANAIALATADFNNDGHQDVAFLVGGSPATTVPGYVTTLLGDGKGALTKKGNVVFPGYPSSVTAADVNGDGCPDLIVLFQHPDQTPAMDVLLGNCDGTFNQLSPVNISADASSLVVYDFNGDGHPDLVLAHTTGLTFMAGNGNGAFQPETAFASAQSAIALALGDLNADTANDLVVTTGVPSALMALIPGFTAQGLRNQSAASYATGPLAPGSLVAAFGSHLATGTKTGPATSLLGTKVTLVDSFGTTLNPTLLYVGPNQVNYLLPPNVNIGLARVTVTSGDGHSSGAQIVVSQVSPGVFTLNSGGLIAAGVKLVHSDGTSEQESLFAVDNGAVVAQPVSLGSSSDEAFLEIYGTGIAAAGQSNVRVRIGGVSAPVSSVGAGFTPGVDEVDAQIPASLAGRGKVSVVLTASGQAANTTSFVVQ